MNFIGSTVGDFVLTSSISDDGVVNRSLWIEQHWSLSSSDREPRPIQRFSLVSSFFAPDRGDSQAVIRAFSLSSFNLIKVMAILLNEPALPGKMIG
jgi:hypothetical protein